LDAAEGGASRGGSSFWVGVSGFRSSSLWFGVSGGGVSPASVVFASASGVAGACCSDAVAGASNAGGGEAPLPEHEAGTAAGSALPGSAVSCKRRNMTGDSAGAPARAGALAPAFVAPPGRRATVRVWGVGFRSLSSIFFAHLLASEGDVSTAELGPGRISSGRCITGEGFPPGWDCRRASLAAANVCFFGGPGVAGSSSGMSNSIASWWRFCRPAWCPAKDDAAAGNCRPRSSSSPNMIERVRCAKGGATAGRLRPFLSRSPQNGGKSHRVSEVLRL